MSSLALPRWIAHLRRLAEPAAVSAAPLGAGALDVPFRGAVCGEPVEAPAEPIGTGELGLWWARFDERVDVDEILAAPTDGSLLPQGLFRTIEVWTDAELSALHALWWLARDRQRDDWRRRLADARDWHLLNTQPDNATNRPWALHVFLLGGTGECIHYAETLLHNCLTMTGRPDPLSAWILLDAARALEEEASG
ncbi:MAG: hypothetical protein SYC29_11720 [Planctomycetota bacterium]|nr:hypothetical protein [Planctomycetota bacterium]